jgi:hypothetical protein
MGDAQIADGEDNNGNGIIDEGIDEDIYGRGDISGLPYGVLSLHAEAVSAPGRAAAGIEQERFESPIRISPGRFSSGASRTAAATGSITTATAKSTRTRATESTTTWMEGSTKTLPRCRCRDIGRSWCASPGAAIIRITTGFSTST